MLTMLHFPAHRHSISPTSPTTPAIIIRMLWWDIPRLSPQVQRFCRMAHRTQHIVIPKVMIYYGKRIQCRVREGKWVKPQRNKAQTSKSSIPSAITQGIVDVFFNEMWQSMWIVANKGDSLETQCPGFLWRSDHIGSVCLACAKIQESQKESRCSA